MFEGSAGLPRGARSPLPLVLGGLIAADLVILAAAAKGETAVLALGAALAVVLIASRAERSLALVMIGYPLAAPVAWLLGNQSLVTMGLRYLAAASLAGAFLFRMGGGFEGLWARCRRHGPLWITVAFAALLQIGRSYTEAPGYGGYKAVGFSLTALTFVVMLTFAGWLWSREEDVASGPRRFLASAWVFLCLIGLLSFVNVLFRFEDFEGRLRVLGLNPIWVGRAAGAGLLMIPYAVRRLGWPVSVVGAMAVVFGAALLWTGSRGPVFSFIATGIAVLLFQWWRRGRSEQRWNDGMMIGAVVLVAASLLLLPQDLKERFLEPGAGGPGLQGESFSWSMRLFLLRSALAGLPSMGLFGIGTGGFSAAAVDSDLRLYPHNILLEVFLENGWPGIVLLALFLFMSVRTALRLLRRPAVSTEAHLGLFLGVFMLGNAMVSGDLTTNEGVWIWGGFIGALQIAAGRDGEDPPGGATSSRR